MAFRYGRHHVPKKPRRRIVVRQKTNSNHITSHRIIANVMCHVPVMLVISTIFGMILCEQCKESVIQATTTLQRNNEREKT